LHKSRAGESIVENIKTLAKECRALQSKTEETIILRRRSELVHQRKQAVTVEGI
jgi:hypothetical protein